MEPQVPVYPPAANMRMERCGAVAPGERKALFASTAASQRLRPGSERYRLNVQDKREQQPRLWNRLPSETTEGSNLNTLPNQMWQREVPRSPTLTYDIGSRNRGQAPSFKAGLSARTESETNLPAFALRQRKDVAEVVSVDPPVEAPRAKAIRHAEKETHATSAHTTEDPRSNIEAQPIQLIDEPIEQVHLAESDVPPLRFKQDASPLSFKDNGPVSQHKSDKNANSVTRETTADCGSTSDRVISMREFEAPLDDTLRDILETPAMRIATFGGNPFAVFRLKHTRSPIMVTDSDLAHVKGVMIAKRHSPDELLSYFKASISVTSVPMMRIILQLLCDVIQSDVSQRAVCVRMMEAALVYHPDELVQCFSCAHIPPLFDPEINDDVGGSFIRLFLSYKATFCSPGLPEGGVPVGIDGYGRFRYDINECEPEDRARMYRQDESTDFYQGPGYDGAVNAEDKGKRGAATNEEAILDFTDCGKIESMALLKICADRADVTSAFDIPASRLRDWLSTIWFELPATRPCLPLMRLCIHWIDSKDDPAFLKDAALALLQKERSLLGDFEGSRQLMLELLSFMIARNGEVSVELAKVVDMVNEGEDNMLYAVMDAIVSRNLRENDMLDLWCLLCILPWPVTSPRSAVCSLMSSTFMVYYQLAYDSISEGTASPRFTSSPMGLLENALRICACRCSSPVLAKGALLQTIMLIQHPPMPALRMNSAPLILASLCPFFWKCHFVWSSCGRDADPDSLLALRHLYDALRTSVFCEPLSSIGSELGARTAPIFPRVRFASDEGVEENVSRFIAVPEQPADPNADGGYHQVQGYEPALEQRYGPRGTPPPAEPDVRPVLEAPRGIRNLGNSCYYNSVLQALFHTRSFVQCLMELPDGKPAVAVYQKMFRKLLKRGKRPFDAIAGYKLLPASWRRNSEQQDVTEVLGHVLESLDGSLGLWRRVFAGMVVRRIKCLHCERLSDNREIAMDFTFPLVGLPSIQAMFDDFCKIETLRGGNKYHCSECNAYRRADTWNVIASPPAHLVVVLSRQVWSPGQDAHASAGGASKVMQHVRVDEHLRVCEFDYTLYGAIFHSGTATSSGHYYFVGRDSEAPSRWHVCDDSQVRPATAATVNDVSQDRRNAHVPARQTAAPLTMRAELYLALAALVGKCLSIRHAGFLARQLGRGAAADARAFGGCRSVSAPKEGKLRPGLPHVCAESAPVAHNDVATSDADGASQRQKTVYLVSPRGFCEGVRRAIQTVDEAVRVFGPPVYVKHEIVHNEFVCNRLRAKGVVFVEDLTKVPEGSVLIFSAHGVSPAVRELAKARNLVEIDASCPLVNKVHVYVKKKAEEGYQIVLIGHKKHVETIGTAGEAPGVTTIVETVEDVDGLDYAPGTKLFYATQTTLSLDDCKLIKERLVERFPWIETIPSGSICYATTNRQITVQKACAFADLLLIVGSTMSSNANRLLDTGTTRNVRGYLIPNADAVTPELIGDARSVAVSASASTPDDLTNGVVEKLAQPPFNFAVEFFEGCEERIPKWRLPRNLEAFIKEHDSRLAAAAGAATHVEG
ncbi:LytB protein, putative [Babesia caballi]|uniref:4-hydroxy-3-methylbut-2-enyl diphosphate reductase n=1 Tax=Babesia caballi TaxID=5871 RepID=A0AAV4LQL1_BABCB|nr:LytB protein, putative [Babesia caballi]